MTCIAAIKHKGKIYVAGDRRASWDMSQAQVMPFAKVIKRDGVILAGTGDCYVLNLITRVLHIPQVDTDIDTYMFHHLQRAIRGLLIEKGFTDGQKILRIPEELETEIVIAISGTLWAIQIQDSKPHGIGIISVDQCNLPYATGCGGQLAWGSLLTTEDMEMKPKDRLIKALKVAAQVSPGCDDKVDIEHE